MGNFYKVKFILLYIILDIKVLFVNRRYSILIGMLLLATLAGLSSLRAAPGIETFKHHKWDVSRISLAISVDSDIPEVENTLNSLANYIESIIGAFSGSDYHVFIGNRTFEPFMECEVVWGSGVLEIEKDITVSKDLFLTIANMTGWYEGEEIFMNETLAEMLAFSIPRKSVFPLPPISPAITYGLGAPNTLGSMILPRLNVEGADIALGMLRNIVERAVDLYPQQMSPFESFDVVVPIPLSYFMVGMVLGSPDAIREYGEYWNSLNQEDLYFNYNYTESDDEATFLLSGSMAMLGVFLSINFEARYSLVTGLLLDMSLSASLSNFPQSIDTYKYGPVLLSISGSINFEIEYTESEDLEPWTSFGEPLAYKVTEISFSPDLEEILRETGLFEDVVDVPIGEELLFFDDVESGNIGWTTTGGWHITTNDSYSGTYSWYTGPYEDNSDWWLKSPEINVSGYSKVNISFAIKYSLEAGCDFGYFRVSWDGGETWEEIDLYTGNSTGWLVYNYQLDVMGDTLLLAFVLQSDYMYNLDGIWIDDIRVAGILVEQVSYIDLLRNLRAVFIYTDNPTGLNAEYEGTLYYYNVSSGAMMEIQPFYAVGPMLVPGSIRVYPYKDILYGQIQLEAHILTNVLPKFVKYYLALAKSEGAKVPEFDMSGSYDVLESIEGHFAMLANVTFSIEYTDVEVGHTPFILDGYGGIWYVYKSTGYLVETGFEFSISLKYDTNSDGSLDDEQTRKYTVKVIVNKVVSERVRAPEAWSINWDRLDSDPPRFTDEEAWNEATPAETAGGKGITVEPWMMGGIIIFVVLIVAVVVVSRRKRLE